MSTQTIQTSLLSATLRAEGSRIRYLRNQARKHRNWARLLDDDNVHKAHHRTLFWELREATLCPSQRARCANLALGFLRGHRYDQIEASTRTPTPLLYSDIASEVAKKAGVNYNAVVAWIKTSIDPASV